MFCLTLILVFGMVVVGFLWVISTIGTILIESGMLLKKCATKSQNQKIEIDAFHGDYCIDLTRMVIIHLNGKNFGTFVPGFDKPFDYRLHNAFVRTSKDLFKQYPGCSVIYTTSDKISMIFPVKQTPSENRGVRIPFSGRIQKLASVVSSYASVRFNHYLYDELINTDWNNVKLQRLSIDALIKRRVGRGIFDAYIYNCDDDMTENLILEKLRRLSIFNSKFSFAKFHLSEEEWKPKTIDQMIQHVEKMKGARWEDLDSWKKYGTVMCREI